MSNKELKFSLLNYIENFQGSHNDISFRLQTLMKIAIYFGIHVNRNYINASVFIDPDLTLAIIEKWKTILQQNFLMSKNEMYMYNQLRLQESLIIADVEKLIEFLMNYESIFRDNKEQILKSNFLVSILAVDGFLGFSIKDLKKYITNLKIGRKSNQNINTLHITTVRAMYETQYIKQMSGNDGAAIVFLSLLTLFKLHVKDQRIIEFYENDVQNYLLKNAENYPDIIKILQNINSLTSFYEKRLLSNVKQIATIKVNQLVPYVV